MLSASEIKNLFFELNEELNSIGEIGEIGIVGGAVMCLVYNARQSTRDVDAIFEPTKTIRKAAEKLAKKHSLAADWLNDAAKAYLRDNFKRQEILSLSNLRVWAPEARYMLAMKCLSARWDTHDKNDVIFLIKHLKIKKPKEVFELIENYYPKKIIPPKTQFLIEEVLEE